MGIAVHNGTRLGTNRQEEYVHNLQIHSKSSVYLSKIKICNKIIKSESGSKSFCTH